MEIKVNLRSRKKSLVMVSNALKTKPETKEELAKKVKLSYYYVTVLYNELVETGRTQYRFKDLVGGEGIRGDRDERNKMIESLEYGLTDIAKKVGVEKEAIRQYVHKYYDYDEWARGRAELLVERGKNPGPLKKYLPKVKKVV